MFVRTNVDHHIESIPGIYQVYIHVRTKYAYFTHKLFFYLEKKPY